ncbi:MAG: MoxR family ATPase [Spirochaetes bacterium]|nr:MoxR family ATPase [Spirochaetota bacterium]
MDYAEIEKITAKVRESNSFVALLKNEISKVVVGQVALLERMIIAFLSGGHILLEGVPGLAKTLLVRAFAKSINTAFSRIQFTPDLLPADLIGTRIYNPKDLDFFTRKGPIFTNILLADEINRAPAKVQSALLQAMEERAVTIGEETYALPKPFMVLATENPIEQEGTYPLPEAQIDRFMMKCLVTYPARDEEREILLRFGEINVERINPVVNPEEALSLAPLIDSIYMSEKLVDYIINIVNATRSPQNDQLKRYIDYGASPRASIALMKAARGIAFLRGRGFTNPDDVKEIAYDVLRHRIILSYEAEADGKTADDVVRMILESVEVP